ncbi:MAG: hypothetical protein A4E49_03286 [Methanosaeta sp. PtaU1.Bin112]|nr:MAG: hypothetical protein A4E49_03286 [Methanosaeta sp. PtaU1.Bin112]
MQSAAMLTASTFLLHIIVRPFHGLIIITAFFTEEHACILSICDECPCYFLTASVRFPCGMASRRASLPCLARASSRACSRVLAGWKKHISA